MTSRVFDLPVHRASHWIFNCYVVEGEQGGFAIVDAGMRSTAERAMDLLVALDGGAAEIATVASHGHSDHVAGMPLLRERMGAATFLPRRCERYLAGERPRVFDLRAMIGFSPMYTQQPFAAAALRQFLSDARRIGFGGGGPFRFPCAPTGFLGDGASLPGAPGWEVLEVPGHSDDALCFYHRASETLLSGDAVVTLDGRAWFNPEWVDPVASAQSEERLRALPVRHLLPGHGVPIEGDIWARALSFRDAPPSRGILGSCARALGRWGDAV